MKVGIHISRKLKIDYDCVDSKNEPQRKKLLDSIQAETKEFDLDIYQIFTHGPRTRRKNKINIDKIRTFNSEKNIELYVHTSYVSIGVWNVETMEVKVETQQDAIRLQHIIDMLQTSRELQSKGLVLHIPSREPQRIFKVLKKLKNYAKKKGVVLSKAVPILLEMPARKAGLYSYENPENIIKLTKLINKLKINWGWCIDTAHLWAGGIKLSEEGVFNKWIKDLGKYKSSIKLLHFNGALEKNFNTGKDYHIIPFSREDAIWGKKNNAENNEVILFCKKNKIPIIIEMNRGTQSELHKAIQIIREI
jgi:endonuclease IV